jgi:hypothetical protein
MLSASRLKDKLEAYASGEISLGSFEDWFYEESIDPIENDELADFSSSVDEALSAYHFGGLSEPKLESLLEELAKADRPFVSRHAEQYRMIVVRENRGHLVPIVATGMALSALYVIGVYNAIQPSRAGFALAVQDRFSSDPATTSAAFVVRIADAAAV